jgi:hypothetical protein
MRYILIKSPVVSFRRGSVTFTPCGYLIKELFVRGISCGKVLTPYSSGINVHIPGAGKEVVPAGAG